MGFGLQGYGIAEEGVVGIDGQQVVGTDIEEAAGMPAVAGRTAVVVEQEELTVGKFATEASKQLGTATAAAAPAATST